MTAVQMSLNPVIGSRETWSFQWEDVISLLNLRKGSQNSLVSMTKMEALEVIIYYSWKVYLINNLLLVDSMTLSSTFL